MRYSWNSNSIRNGSRRVPELESLADKVGVEAGLHDLSEREFEGLAQAELASRARERYGEGPDLSLMLEGTQSLRERGREIEAKLEAAQAALASAGASRGVKWRRICVAWLMAFGLWSLLHTLGVRLPLFASLGLAAIATAFPLVDFSAARLLQKLTYIRLLFETWTNSCSTRRLQERRLEHSLLENLGELWKSEQFAIVMGRYRLQRSRGARAAQINPSEE